MMMSYPIREPLTLDMLNAASDKAPMVDDTSVCSVITMEQGNAEELICERRVGKGGEQAEGESSVRVFSQLTSVDDERFVSLALGNRLPVIVFLHRSSTKELLRLKYQTQKMADNLQNDAYVYSLDVAANPGFLVSLKEKMRQVDTPDDALLPSYLICREGSIVAPLILLPDSEANIMQHIRQKLSHYSRALKKSAALKAKVKAVKG